MVMKNPYEERLGELEQFRWLSIKDCSEKLGVSKRTVFQYLKDGKIRGTLYGNRRIIDSVSIIGFLYRKRVIDYHNIKNEEVRKQIKKNI